MPSEYSNDEIEVFVKNAQSGSVDAFEKLYTHFFDKIFRYISFKVDGDQVEDLTAEVFLKVIGNLNKYKHQKNKKFASWIFKITHNLIIDFYRKQKELLGINIENENFFLELPDTKSPTPDQITDQTFQQKELLNILRKLPPQHQEILQLKFLEEFSNLEIAQITGKTEGNIRIIQLRALREMRTHFPREET